MLPVAPGVSLRLGARWDARVGSDPQPELTELSSVAGARVVAWHSLVGPDHVRLQALCATAPSDRWVPGIEEIVLDRAMALTRRGVPGEIVRWEPGAVRAAPAGTGSSFEQGFTGGARQGEGSRAVRGRILLGFEGEERSALLCSVLCTEPAVASAAGSGCESLVEATALEGELAAPPAPGAVVRGLLLVAEHPRPVGAALVLAAVTGIVVLLQRRPRHR
ncbi:Hypothetical protein CAP_7254 [Chondromyces apiculatus DSM 436]|uniref:Uncharacterized protein n=1 Tax=Chondromyces apiculatus DSM 436 TaxID=1192034 RepID=A0A017T0D9_9BACT|nr:Hypothetical protein CAP_7254 [Chondromyces apiculatus DSM 436]